MRPGLLLLPLLFSAPGFGPGCQAESDPPAAAARPGQPQEPQEPRRPDAAAPAAPKGAATPDEPAARAPAFASNAFPPTLSDTEWHRDPWLRNDCLRCHETGVGDAPEVKHEGLAAILLDAQCRTCHVQIPGAAPRERPPAAPDPDEPSFAPNAFPPLIPASSSHRTTWLKDDCLLCHEKGISGAPAIRHAGMPEILKSAKCRTCHVQVRALEAGPERN